MNVAGIGPVGPAVTPDQAKPAATPHQGKPAATPDQGAKPAAVKPPPVKPLSTTEMQVMMGAIHPEVLLDRAAQAGKGGFDTYA
jgi:hypothetical protein